MTGDVCRCGHARALHRVTRGPGTIADPARAGCCDACVCDGFIKDARGAWAPLVRAAELVLREQATLEVTFGRARSNEPRVWTFNVRTLSDLDLNAPAGMEHQELAELTGTRWLDESVRAHPKAMPAEARECATCHAGIGKQCRPMHAGEREPGGWVHPTREAGKDAKESEVVRWAMRVKAGEQREIWPGIRPHMDFGHPESTVMAAVTRVVDEILALAHINECLLLACNGSGQPNVNDKHEHHSPMSSLFGDQAIDFTVIDNVTYSANDVIVHARLRVFDSREATMRAVPDAPNDADGEIARHVFAAIDAGGGRVSSSRVTREAVRQPQRAVPNAAINDRVGQARQQCNMCNGTGIIDDRGVPQPCDCAAGNVARFRDNGRDVTGAELKRRRIVSRVASRVAPPPPVPGDRRTALQRTRDRVTSAIRMSASNLQPGVDDPAYTQRGFDVVAFRAVREGRADAAETRRVALLTAECQCTWGSPCEEHGPYW